LQWSGGVRSPEGEIKTGPHGVGDVLCGGRRRVKDG
jgi:hypothetical protein